MSTYWSSNGLTGAVCASWSNHSLCILYTYSGQTTVYIVLDLLWVYTYCGLASSNGLTGAVCDQALARYSHDMGRMGVRVAFLERIRHTTA